ncbi:hypothetical protein [Tautonia sociabilis]|uniref:Uncharacterized protein n=1 Tax=Tautonia sociabilis TaxID=2080755 RepID=A0A432MNQ9_9BACT|nr:hypothetical protein [Tautonia sociabilis]RUL88889.1 hypothetical protein TsocGM_04570 [Tautonia sociabilis]
MTRFRIHPRDLALSTALSIALAGCGGGEPAIDEEIDVADPVVESPEGPGLMGEDDSLSSPEGPAETTEATLTDDAPAP